MQNTYFMHRIKHTLGENNGTWDKGIEIHETVESAKQAYHAYLGNYGYGRVANVDYVKCRIDDMMSGEAIMEEEWFAHEPEPVAES